MGMSLYSNLSVTLREVITASLTAVSDQIADIEAAIESATLRQAGAIDPTCAQNLVNHISTLNGSLIGLQNEKARLEDILASEVSE